MLTIVTVAYKDGPRLRETIQSLMPLSGDIEFLCVIPSDDHSTRNVYFELSGGLHIPSRLVADPGNGIYEAMNFAVLTAEGSYITFWNAGDTLHSSSNLNNMMRDMENKNSDWGISIAKTDWESFPVSSQRDVVNFIQQRSPKYFSHQCIIEKRSLLNQFGRFNLRYRVAADTNHIYQLASFSKPSIFQNYVVSVEKPFFAGKHHRLSRKETFFICVNNLQGIERAATVLRLISRELSFFRKKVLKTN